MRSIPSSVVRDSGCSSLHYTESANAVICYDLGLRFAEMRAGGSSYGALVMWLNEQGIKTKSGVQQWDRSTVFKVLKRHGTSDFSSDALISKQT